MKNKRDKERNTDKINGNRAAAIGMVNGSVRFSSDPALEEKYHNWVEECAKSVKACSHSIEETEKFFLRQCEAIPINQDDYRMKSYQYSVVLNYYRDKLNHKLSDFPLDMKDEEIEKWDRELEDIRREIMDTSTEYYGIKISGYYLPQSERNLYLYEEAKEEIQKMEKQRIIKQRIIDQGTINQEEDVNIHRFLQDICFFFEKTTEDIQCNNGGRSLIHKIAVFRGVKEEDIRTRNSRFCGYLFSMCELGYLPDFRKQ